MIQSARMHISVTDAKVGSPLVDSLGAALTSVVAAARRQIGQVLGRKREFGQSAPLNLGDCFAYGTALTDIASARA